MEKSIKCPICGKEGIPDFHKEDVVCPCCGSDLSVYRKINSLVTINGKVGKTGKSSVLLGIVGLLAISLVFLVLKHTQGKEQIQNQDPAEFVKQVKLLNDSIVKLNEELEAFRKNIAYSKIVKSNTYVVKKGDSFCKISKKMLGSEKYYLKIAELNNLQATSILYVGDTLKMPIK